MILPSDRELDSENINPGMVYREKEGFQNTHTHRRKRLLIVSFLLFPAQEKKCGGTHPGP